MDNLTITDILQQAQTLSPQERKELVKLLVDSLEVGESVSHAKTGKQIAAMLAAMEPIELVDQEIADPVEWVAAQRQKEANRLKPFWGNNG